LLPDKKYGIRFLRIPTSENDTRRIVRTGSLEMMRMMMMTTSTTTADFETSFQQTEPKQMHAHKIAAVTAVERISDGYTEEKAWLLLLLRCCKQKRAERWRQNWSADILLGRKVLDLRRPRAQKTQK
jgi:hypothetical protein